MSGKAFTSYNENTDMANDFIMLGNDPANALHDTYLNTKKFAEEQRTIPPENTKANPADRVKSYRKGISWNTAEERNNVLASEKFKKSAMTLIHCVLAAQYGESVTIEAKAAAEIPAQTPGAKFFLAEMVKALYGDPKENLNGLQIDPEKIFFIYHNNTLMGLFSPTGPIPSVENEFSFINFPPIRESEIGLNGIMESLDSQDKKLLKFWLKEAIAQLHSSCKLFEEILANLENIAVDATIEQGFKISDLNNDTLTFPTLRDFPGKMLWDVITIFPVVDKEHAKFGYDFPALTVEINGLYYAFIPPLSEIAVGYAQNDNFAVEKIFIDWKQSEITGSERDYVTVQCDLRINNIEFSIRQKYIFENIRSIKGFPTLSLYGPAPKFGWIARRDLEEERWAAQSLKKVQYDIINMESVAGIDIGGMKFDPISDEYKYSLYTGPIPVWAGIRGNGVFLGAIPLRAVSAEKERDWKTSPLFVKKQLPQNGKMIVAVDIGSSRSVVLFKRSDNGDEANTLVEKDQILGVYLTGNSDGKKDAAFEILFFQPEKQVEKIAGKTPVGVFKTGYQEGEEAPALFKSGKLIFFDPKSISTKKDEKKDEKKNKTIISRMVISDIKSAIGKNNGKMEREKQYEMNLLVQGLMTMIIEQSLRMQCSDIEIRIAYLTEQRGPMEPIWQAAKNAIIKNMPEDKVNIDIAFRLPESLAIANRICYENGFKAGSGAAFVDVGDLSTDIALFQNTTATETNVELKNNISFRFAGNKIILEPLWEFIHFSSADKIDGLFKPNDELKAVIEDLKDQLATQRNEKRFTPDDVRNNLLCLIGYLNENIPDELRNLFDMGCLAEMLILRRLIERENIKKAGGKFYIHLFGGGSSYFKKNKEGFDWDTVMDRECDVENASGDGRKLALGLFGEIDTRISAAARAEEKRADNYRNGAPSKNVSNYDASLDLYQEMKSGYIHFINQALKLHPWKIPDGFGRPVMENMAFNLNEDFTVINDEGIFSDKYVSSMDFANEVKIADQNGAIDDIEIKKCLFAYKMAILTVIEFFKRERNK